MTFYKMRAVSLGLQPFSQLTSPMEIIRQFTPNWFAATMGTGILAIALAQLPDAFSSLGKALWLFNIALFTLFSALYAARWILFFHEAKRIFGHSVVSMFFGCIPMGLATIINGFLIFGLPSMGSIAIEVATVLWWIDVGMAALCGIAIPYLMFTRQSHAIDQMTAVWLLPMVAAEVAAVSGGLLAPHLADAHTQLLVLVWLPHVSMAASSWLALGPIGTGALGLMTLGQAAPAIFAANDLGQYSSAAAGIGLIGGLLMWGYGLWWFAMAVLITGRYARDGLPFNLGWWGYTFPLGVFAADYCDLCFWPDIGGTVGRCVDRRRNAHGLRRLAWGSVCSTLPEGRLTGSNRPSHLSQKRTWHNGKSYFSAFGCDRCRCPNCNDTRDGAAG